MATQLLERTETESSLGNWLVEDYVYLLTTAGQHSEKMWTTDYEIVAVSFSPFYLLREFGQITVILTYVTGPNNSEAADRIAQF